MSADTDSRPIVEMRGITIRFPGVLALDDVDFVLRPGEVHSLMGENGAGQVHPDQGAHRRLRRSTAGPSPSPASRACSASRRDAQAAGISTVYQEVNLCRTSRSARTSCSATRCARCAGSTGGTTHREAARHLASLGLHIDTRSMLASHSIAIQQLVAISRAMVLDSRVLILDEPTSSLDRRRSSSSSP